MVQHADIDHSGLTGVGSMTNPMTTSQDIIVGGVSGAPGRLAKGSDGQVLTVDPTTHNLLWATPSSGFSDPMTSRGDIIVRNAGNTTARLAKGSAGTYLGSDGTDVAYAAVTDAQLSTSDITTNNASTSKHGFLKKLSNVATEYMDGTGAWSTPAGGGSGGFPLDSYSLDGTYGDHFTAASLNTSLWTRRNYTSGAETYQVGKDGTWLRISTASRTNGDGYLQASTADGTYACKLIYRFYGANIMANLGVALVDSAGSGVVLGLYNNPAGMLLQGVTTYSSYGGSFQGIGGNTNPITATALYGFHEVPVWMYIRKSGSSTFGAYSLDGEAWSPESASFTWAGTMNRVGLLHAGLGNVVGTTGNTAYIDIDWFNKIA